MPPAPLVTQGGYYFIWLDTSRRINRCDWTSLPMPQTVIDQVHCLTRRAKSKTTLTSTNTRNEDLDILYADLLDDEQDDNTAADDDDHGNDDDSNYNPNGDDDKTASSEDEAYNDSNDDNSEGNIDNSAHNLDNDENPAELAGVDDGEVAPTAYDTEEANGHISAADNNNTAGEDDDNSTTSADQNTREYQAPADQFGKGIRMRLRNQPRKNYNVFSIDGEKETEEILLLQFDQSSDCELDERALDRLKAEWLFLTETLEWKKALPEVNESSNAKRSEG